MLDKLKKKKTVVLLLVVCLLLIAGASYAVYSWTFNGTLTNLISTEDVSLKFLESNNEIISVENAAPMTDEEGVMQEEEFEFAVTSETKRNTVLNYTLSLEKLSADSGYTLLSDSDIKVYLEDYDGNVLLEPTLVSNLNNYKLYTGSQQHDSTRNTVQDKFVLKVWIDQSKASSASSWNNTTKIQYKFRINVGGTESTNTYTVTAAVNGGSVVGDSTKTVASGSTAKFNLNPTNTSYKASVSCTNSQTGTVSNNTLVVKNVTNNTICTVTYNTNVYYVKYNANGGSGTMSNTTFLFGETKALSKNTFTKSGSTFLGWSTSSNATEPMYEDMEEVKDLSNTSTTINLYAVWSGGSYTILLDNQEAKTPGTEKIYYQYDSSNTINSSTCYYYTDKYLTDCVTSNTITSPTKTGNTFGGYYTATGGSGTQYINSSGSIINNLYKTVGDRTLYAKWTVNNYVLTANANSGSIPSTSGWSGTGASATKNIAYGSTYGTLPTPTRTGFTFKGWYTSEEGGVQVTSDTTMDAKATTIYAHWEGNTYSATFYYQSNTEGGSTKVSHTMESCKITTGTSCTITIPTEVRNSVGTYNNAYAGLNTAFGADMSPDIADTETTITLSEDTDYYAIYSSEIKLYYPTSTSAATNKTMYRNQWFTSKTALAETVLSSTATGTTSDATAGALVSGYDLEGFGTNVSQTTPVYSSVDELRKSASTTVYQIESKTTDVTARFYYSNSAVGAKTSSTVTGTRLTKLKCSSTTSAGSTTIQDNLTPPDTVAPYGTTLVGWAGTSTNMIMYDTTTARTSYYAVYQSEVDNYYYNVIEWNTRTLYRTGRYASATNYTMTLSTSSTETSNVTIGNGPGSSAFHALITAPTFDNTEDEMSVASAAASGYTDLYATYRFDVSYQKGNNVSSIGASSGNCLIEPDNTTCAVSLPSITPNSGYTAVGWSETANVTTGSTGDYELTSNNMTLYGNVIVTPVVNPVRIYYSQNGGVISGSYYQNYKGWVQKINPTSSDCQVDGYFCQTVNAGTSTDLYNYNNSNGIYITRSGYYAVAEAEWCTARDGSGTCFNQNTNYTYNQFKAAATAKTGFYELDLFVHWIAKPVYIYFHPNGGAVGGSIYTTYNGWISKTGSSYFYWNVSSTTTDNLYNVGTFSITRSNYTAISGKEWCNNKDGTGTCFNQDTNYSYSTYKAAANKEKATYYELDLWVNWKIGSHTHSWTQKGNAALYIGGQYEVGGASYPDYANGVYCSLCHMSGWCYAWESTCGAHGSIGGTLYATNYLPPGWSTYDDSSLGMTFTKYKTYKGNG